MAVAGLKLVARDQKGRVGPRLGVVRVGVQRHLLFTCRHLLNRTADILAVKKNPSSSVKQQSAEHKVRLCHIPLYLAFLMADFDK